MNVDQIVDEYASRTHTDREAAKKRIGIPDDVVREEAYWRSEFRRVAGRPGTQDDDWFFVQTAIVEGWLEMQQAVPY